MPQASVWLSSTLLDVEVEPLALGQQLVELVLAEHRAQRGLRELAGGLEELRDLDHRLLRVDHAEVQHRVDLHRDVVARDHVLRRHVEARWCAGRPAPSAARTGISRTSPGPFTAQKRPEHEHHAALVLAQDAHRHQQQHHDQHDRTPPNPKAEFRWLIHPCLRAFTVVRPAPPQAQPVARHDPHPLAALQRHGAAPLPSARRGPGPSLAPSAVHPAPRRCCRSALPGPLTTRPLARLQRQLATAENDSTALDHAERCDQTAAECRSPARRCRSASARRARSAITPPRPSAPKLGRKTSATMNAMPSRISASPA